MSTAPRPKLRLAVDPRNVATFKLGSGYAFQLATGKLWSFSVADDWDTVVTCDDERSTCVGALRIDDAPCLVYLCSDGAYRAQTFAFAGCAEMES